MNATARLIVWISGVFYGSPPRMTYNKFLVRPPIEFLQAARCAEAEIFISSSPVSSINFLFKLKGPSHIWMILPDP